MFLRVRLSVNKLLTIKKLEVDFSRIWHNCD